MIVLACFEVPGYGGAATLSYLRFQQLQQRGLPVAYLNLIPAEHREFLESQFGARLGNPQGLADVHNCWIEFPPFREQPALGKLLARLGPHSLVGCGYIAAWLLHRMAPELPLTFLTAGFRWAQELISAGHFRDYLSLQEYLEHSGSQGLPPFHPRQQEAFLACRTCVTHAPMITDLYRTLFPDQASRIHPEILWNADTSFAEAQACGARSRPFTERNLDLLFVASRWDRPEKNYGMVREIAQACPDLRIGIVGLCPDPPDGVRTFGMISQRLRLLELLGDARVLVSPSVFDAAPGILYEGAAMGCNLVASRNCGNWSLVHPALLVERFLSEAFVESCRRAVQKPYADQRSQFMTRDSHAALAEILLYGQPSKV